MNFCYLFFPLKIRSKLKNKKNEGYNTLELLNFGLDPHFGTLSSLGVLLTAEIDSVPSFGKYSSKLNFVYKHILLKFLKKSDTNQKIY